MNLKAQEKKNISFVIRVPEGTDAGDHTGGILIQKATPEDATASNGSTVKLTTRVGVRIYETVPGEVIKQLTLKEFKVIKNFQEFSFADWFGKIKKPQEYLIQSTVSNEGNISVDQRNIVHIKDLLFGKRNDDIDRTFQVMKKDTFISNYSWNNPRFGRFSFVTEVKYENVAGEEISTASEEIKIWIMPWREVTIALILLGLFLVCFWFWKIYQKKTYGKVGWVNYVVKEGDNIQELAARFNIKWKVLAKSNGIKAPYFLQQHQVIMVPPTDEYIAKLPDEKTEEIIEAKNEELNKEEKESVKQEGGIERKKEEIGIISGEIKTEYFKEEAKEEIKDLGSEIENETIALGKKDIVSEIFSRKPEISAEVKAKTEKNKKTFLKKTIIVPIIIVAVIVAVALILVFSRKQEEKRGSVDGKISISNIGKEASDVKVEASSEEKEVSKEEKILKPEDVNIKVLNGGAVPGSAGKVKESLMGAGYKSEAQNASKDDFGGVTIFYDDGFKEIAESVKNLLKNKYPNAEVKTASSDEEKSSDVVVILGK